MPRRRKRIGKLAQHGQGHSRTLPGRFDEGYNLGEKGAGTVTKKAIKSRGETLSGHQPVRPSAPKVHRRKPPTPQVPRTERAAPAVRGLPIGELSKKVRMGPDRALQPVGEFKMQRPGKPVGRPKAKGNLPPQAAAPAQQNRRQLQQKERDLARRRYGA